MADGNIFISYRRGVDSNAAGRLYDRLERQFDHSQLFFDIDSIPLGVDFAEHIDGEVAKCDVLLAIIGPGWLEEVHRLADPGDFVRIEVEAALKRPDIPVIPVLLEGAQMPPRDHLPESLHPLVRRNAIVLSHAQFAQIVDGRLGNELKGIFAEAAAEARRAEHEAERKRQAKDLEVLNQIRKAEAEKRAIEESERNRQAKAEDEEANEASEISERDQTALAKADEKPQTRRKADTEPTSSERSEGPHAPEHPETGRLAYLRLNAPKALAMLIFLVVLVSGLALLLKEPYYKFGWYLSAAESVSAGGVEFQKIGEGLCRVGEQKPDVISTYFNQSITDCASLCAFGPDCRGFGSTIQQSENVDIRDCELFASKIDRVETSQREVYCYNRK